MKRRGLFVFVSAVMATAMCACIAGCGVNAEGVKGEVITEKQWNSALDYFAKEDAVYTIECREEQAEERMCEYVDEKLSGGVTCVQTIKAIKNGSKEYLKETKKIEFSGDYKKISVALDQDMQPVDEEEETYAEKKEYSFTVYYKGDDDKWTTKNSYSSLTYGKISEVLLNMSISLSFGSYEYNDSLKGYVLKNSFGSEFVYVLKFNGDGMLSAIYFEYEITTKSSNREHMQKDVFNVVINYNAKEVILPTVS